MKNFTKTFTQTLIYNVATISAIIVGVVSFMVRSFNQNNGKEKVKNITLTVLDKIDLIVLQMMDKIDTDVPDVEVAQ
jgi:energy-converting hydrogenase Eha subunit G